MTYDLKVIEVTVVFIYITYLFSTYRYEQHAYQFFLSIGKLSSPLMMFMF